MKHKTQFYTIIPAHNEETHIRKVILEVKKYCNRVIVVDDGSTDNTNKIARKHSVTLITLPINMGKGYALRVGAEHAFSEGAGAVITIDSDGQHKPSHIPKFIAALKNNDVAIGVRSGYHKIPLIRKIGNRLATMLVFMLYRIYVDDLLCGFRAFNKGAFKKIKWVSHRYGVETEMIAKVGMSKLKFAQVKIENIYLDQFKGVTIFDAIEVFLSIPKFKINNS